MREHLVQSYRQPQLGLALGTRPNEERIELAVVRPEALALLRRGQTTNLQERLEISERAAAGQSDPEIAAALEHHPQSVAATRYDCMRRVQKTIRHDRARHNR